MKHASEWIDLGGIFYFSWVIPAGIIVTIMGLAYIPFLCHLPRRTALLFMASGAIFVGGALGTELLLSSWTEYAGRLSVTYGMIDLLQESMEFFGVSLFLYSLAEYLDSDTLKLHVGFFSRFPTQTQSSNRASERQDRRSAAQANRQLEVLACLNGRTDTINKCGWNLRII